MAAPKKVPLSRKIKNAIKKRVKSIAKFIGYKWVLPLVYKWYARKPIDNKLVVFADHRDRDMPDNFLNMYTMCQQNGFCCEVLSGKPFGNSVPKWRRRKEKLKFHLKFVKLFAKCRVLFLVDYFAPAYIISPRPGSDIVQLWHACGAMKLFGFSTDGRDWGLSAKDKQRYRIHSNYTLASVSGPKALGPYRSAFHCPSDAIQALGSPRTDIYFDEKFRHFAKQKVQSMIPNIGNRKIILYAPTYRGKSIAKSYIKSELNYKELKIALSDQYVLLTKFHPLMASGGLAESERLQALGFVFDVSKTLTPEEALCAADILITDYSSIMFEYLLLERPIISYIYDIDIYIKDRGLYYPYEQLAPGPYVFTQEELTEKLQTVPEWFDLKKAQRYREEFMSACDGHSTEKIYQYIFGQAPSGSDKA